MAKQKNAVPTLSSTPAVVTPAAEAKVKKTPRAQIDALLKAGIITAEQVAEADKKGLITSGEGGGLSVDDQMTKAGADAADVKLLNDTMERINKAIKGKKDELNREIVGVATWVKHKAEKKAAETPAQS